MAAVLRCNEQAAQSQLEGWQGAPEASMSALTESLEPSRDCGMEGLWCEGAMVWRDHGASHHAVKLPDCIVKHHSVKGMWCGGTMVWRDCGVKDCDMKGPWCGGTVVWRTMVWRNCGAEGLWQGPWCALLWSWHLSYAVGNCCQHEPVFLFIILWQPHPCNTELGYLSLSSTPFHPFLSLQLKALFFGEVAPGNFSQTTRPWTSAICLIFRAPPCCPHHAKS